MIHIQVAKEASITSKAKIYALEKIELNEILTHILTNHDLLELDESQKNILKILRHETLAQSELAAAEISLLDQQKK